MKTLKLLLSILLLSSGLMGCAEKADPIQAHEAARPERRDLPPVDSSMSNYERIQNWRDRLGQEGTPGAEALRELADLVLDQEALSSQLRRDDSYWHDLLIVLNSATLALLRSGRDQELATWLSEKFASTVKLECEGIRSSCVGLVFLSRAGNSSQVLKEMAKLEKDDVKSFQLLLAAFELKNQTSDPELGKLLLARLPKQLEFLASLGQPRAQVMKQRLRPVLETALAWADQYDSSAWADVLPLWSMLLDKDLGLGTPAQIIVAKQISRSHLVGMNHGFHRDFLKFDAQYNSNPHSLTSVENVLRTSHSKQVEELGLKFPRADLLMKILNLIYVGAIEPEVALSLVRSQELDMKSLKQDVKAFVQIHFLMGVIESTRIARRVMFDAKVPVENMFFNALDQSAVIRQVWSNLKDRLAPVQKFLTASLRERGGTPSEIEDIRREFEGLDRSIKLSVVYPHMMALFHVMSKKRFELFNPWTGQVFEAADLMVYLYNGEVPGLLPYTDDESALTSMEMLYSIDIGIRAGVFEGAGIDVDDFIGETVDRFGEKILADVRAHQNLMRSRLDGTGAVQEFRAYCEDIKHGWRRPKEIFWDELRLSPYFGSMLDLILSDMTALASSHQGGGATVNIKQSLMFLDNTLAESVERLRVDVGNLLRMAEAMRASAGTDRELPRTEQTIQKLKQNRETYLTDLKSYMETYGWCFNAALRQDFDVRSKLVRAERAYWAQVHRDIVRLRSPNLTADQAAKISQKYQLSGMPSDFKGYDRITPDGYTFSKVDALIRVARFMREGLVTDTERIEPIAPNIRVNFGSRMDDEVQWIRDAIQIQLPFSDEKDFVEAGLKAFYSQHIASGPVSWMGAMANSVSYWNKVILTMSSLLRMDEQVETKILKMEDLIKFQQDMIELTQLKEDERELMRVLKIEQKWHPMYFDDVMVDFHLRGQKIRSINGFFDFPLEMMAEPLLGRNFEFNRILKEPDLADDRLTKAILSVYPHRNSMFETAKDYYRLRTNVYRQSVVLPFSDRIDSTMDRQILAFYQTEKGSYEKFAELTESFARQLEAVPESERLRFDVRVNESYQGPYLTPSLLPNLKHRYQEFDRATDFCFSQQMRCASFSRK